MAKLSARAQQLRKLGAQLDEALVKRAAAEDEASDEEIEALSNRYDVLEDEYLALAEKIWSEPAKSWSDVIERAELAYTLTWEDPATHLTDECSESRAVAQLIMAVLAMNGGPAWARPNADSCDKARAERSEAA